MSLDISDIRSAAAQLAGVIVDTPCLHARTLSEITGATVYLKFENLQFTGSFKDRGALVKLLSLPKAARRRGVIAMSAGNHAQGVAYHAQRLGIPATIVMPQGTPNVKVRQTRHFGPRVLLEGESLDAAAAFAHDMAKREKLTFIHPYDDPLIVAGQGTVALEMLSARPDIDTLLVPVGGGGLIAGCAVAAEGLGGEVTVVGVETELYPSMRQAFDGTPGECGGQSIAEGIAVKAPGKLTLALSRERVKDVLLVRESEIERAISLLVTIEKTVVEGAGAAPLAALLAYPETFRGRTVGLILSGGNIDSRLLSSILMRELIRDGRITRMRIEISDRPGVLAAVAGIIGAANGNILEVQHQRMFPDVPAKLAEVDIVVETLDREHVGKIEEQLEAEGFRVRELIYHQQQD